MNLNKATILGHVGKQPEIRLMQNGNKVASFSVATTDKWNDKVTGEVKEATQWHRVVIFGDGLAGVVENYLSKGDKVYIEGKIETRSYEKDGISRNITEIVLRSFDSKLILLGGKNDQSGNEQQTRIDNQDDLDDIPF